MAVDMFLDLDGIAGESTDSKYSGKIQIISMSWAMTQTGTTHIGSGGGGGKVSVQDISLTKFVDKATPNLIKFCCNGKHIAKGKIIVRKAGQNPLDYVVIELENIIVSSISSGATGREDLLVENVGLNFSKFNYIYTPQNRDGTGAGAIEAPWDIARNTSS